MQTLGIGSGDAMHMHPSTSTAGSPHVRRPVNAATNGARCQARSPWPARLAGPAAAGRTCHVKLGVKESGGLCQLSRGMHAHVAGGGSEVQDDARIKPHGSWFLVTSSSWSRTPTGRNGQGDRPGACDHARRAERTRPPRSCRLASLIKAFGTACLMTCFCDLHACTG